jgi:PPM family protein phosphatase
MADPAQPIVSQALSREPAVPAARVQVEVGARSHRGHVRESNEDAFLVFRLGRYLERIASNIPEAELPSRFDASAYLMIVADGLGGESAGDVASHSALVTTLDLILKSPKWALKLDDPALREAEIRDMVARSQHYVAAVQAALRRQAAGSEQLAGMGTTLTGCYSVGTDLFVLHIGDSKAYLFRDGTLRRITRDHTVAQECADLGVIPQEEVASHGLQHVLTRALGGADDELEGEMYYLGAADGDRLLLCSDGLTGMASDEQIAASLARHPGSDDACQALVDLALAGGGEDNVTVIVAGYRVE